MLLWFAETALIAAALAAVAALVPRLRTLGPAARHALWLLVLIKLVTPPLVRSPWPVSLQAVLGLGASTPAVVELPTNRRRRRRAVQRRLVHERGCDCPNCELGPGPPRGGSNHADALGRSEPGSR